METRAEKNFDDLLNKVRRYPARVSASPDHGTIVAKWISVIDHVSYLEYTFTPFGSLVSVRIGNLNPASVYNVEDFDTLINLYQEIM